MFTSIYYKFCGGKLVEINFGYYLLLRFGIISAVRSSDGFYFSGSSNADIGFIGKYLHLFCSTMVQCTKGIATDSCREFEIASQNFINEVLINDLREK